MQPHAYACVRPTNTSAPADRYPLPTTAIRGSDEARMHWNQLYVFHFGCQTYTVSLTRCIHTYMFSCTPAQLLVLYSTHPLTVFVSLFCVAMPAVGFRVLPSRMEAVSYVYVYICMHDTHTHLHGCYVLPGSPTYQLKNTNPPFLDKHARSLFKRPSYCPEARTCMYHPDMRVYA